MKILIAFSKQLKTSEDKFNIFKDVDEKQSLINKKDN
jgi:hypothetical protein